MRISDWSSDVCSSDLELHSTSPNGVQGSLARLRARRGHVVATVRGERIGSFGCVRRGTPRAAPLKGGVVLRSSRDRKSVVEGKSVSVRVDLGGRSIIKKKKTKNKERE